MFWVFFAPAVCTGHCSNYQFMCDDGCCIDITYACDGKQHCPDRSDEDFCSNCESAFPLPPPPPQRFSRRDELEMPAKLNRRVAFRWFQSTATGSRWPTRPICRAFVGPEPRRSGMRMTLGHKRPWTDLRTVARLCKAPVKRRLRSIQVCFRGVLFVCLFNFCQTNNYMIYELIYTDRKDQKTQNRCTQYTQEVPGQFINTP